MLIIVMCSVRVYTVSSFFSFRPVSGKKKYDILDRFSHTACIKENEKRFVFRFYRAMHFSAKRGIGIACRLSVRLSVCDVGEL